MIDQLISALPADLGGTVLCAVSGGPDSVALLHAMLEAAKVKGFEVCVAHFNHGIRGADADADEAFVEELCRQYSVAVKCGRGDVPAIAKSQGKSLELAARDERYAFLYGAADEFGAKYIALGHHMDDQAETVLLNLVRGTGLQGLKGMRTVNGRLLRPLLGLRRSQILGYAVENGLEYRVDLTNLSTDYSRNLVRSIIPEFEKINKSFVNSVYRTSKLLTGDEEVLEGITQREYDQIMLENGVDAARLMALPEAIRSRVLRKMAAQAGLTFDFEQRHVEEVLALCALGTGKRIDLPHGYEARMSYGAMRIAQKDEPREEYDLALAQDGPTQTPDGTFFCELSDMPGELGKNWPYEIECDPFALIGARVRRRGEGDRIHPLGAPGMKKLKDVLIDKKIDRLSREMPLVCRGSEVLWAVGVAMSESVRVTGGATILKLRFEPKN